MLTITNVKIIDNILYFLLLIESDPAHSYAMAVDLSTDALSVIDSEVPDEYKIYERQARAAIMAYRGKKMPTTITSSWC